LSAVLDRFVLEKAPGPLVDIDPSLARARSAFGGLLDTLAAMRDEQLTYQWMWGEHQADIRYGFYRVLEMLEGATSAARLALAGQPSSEARDAVGAATAARWGLHGVLATLNDADLDADAGGGEWTIRRTMGHIINSQRGYAWGSAYWISVRDEPRKAGPQRAPDDAFGSDFPEEEDEPTGSLAQVRRKLDDIVDATSARYATLTTEDLEVMGGWSGFPVTIGFRQWRWSSHIQEHTVQIEKTIDLLKRPRSEVDWLVRANARAFGQLGATTFGRASAGPAGPILDELADELGEMRSALATAAAAAVPAEDW
jgi:hypothetical protein